MSKLLSAIIPAVSTIIGGLIVLFVTVIIKRGQTKDELKNLINSIILEGDINLSTLDPKLYEIKEFFLRNEKLRKKNEAFFEKWLMTLQFVGITTGSHWTEERAREVVKDLEQLSEANCQ